MSVIKRRVLTVSDKVKVIRAIDGGMSKLQAAKEFGLAKTTVFNIYGIKDKIIAVSEGRVATAAGPGGDCKRIRRPSYEQIDQAVVKWLKELDLPPSYLYGRQILDKAKMVAESLGITDFKGSNGWLDKFKTRHGFKLSKSARKQKKKAETAEVEEEDEDRVVARQWLEDVWPEISKKYREQDVFNCNETGLMYRMPPDQTNHYLAQDYTMSSERLTVLVCANMTGTEKRPLLVLGGVKRRQEGSYPTKYKSNATSLMTSRQFRDEISDWDRELRPTQRRILLLVDNCPVHQQITNVSNIKFAYLPANTSQLLQPMDRGVIRSLKLNYRRKFLLRWREEEQVGLQQALEMLTSSWERVSKWTIRKSYQDAGLTNWEEEQTRHVLDVDVEKTEWIERHKRHLGVSGEELEEFVNADDHLPTFTEESDEEEDEEQEVEVKLEHFVDVRQALAATRTLTHFLTSCNNMEGCEDVLKNLSAVENKVEETYWDWSSNTR